MTTEIINSISSYTGASVNIVDTTLLLIVGIVFGYILKPLIKFILSSYLHLKKLNPKVVGEISSDIGIGLFVNSTFQISTGGDDTNYTSVTIMLISSIILIIIGSIWKWRQ